MADDETAAEASANEVAQTAGGVVELYRKSLLVDQVALRHLAVQADQAVATTRAQAISSLARVNLEELQRLSGSLIHCISKVPRLARR